MKGALESVTNPVLVEEYPDRIGFWRPYVNGERSMRGFFKDWLIYAPAPEDPGFYIRRWDCLSNTGPGVFLTNEQEQFKAWIVKFLNLHGKFINSKESHGTIEAWVSYEGTEEHPFKLSEYVIPRNGFQTFNQFFLRELKDGRRPIAGLNDRNIVVSPNDGGTFSLTNGAELPTKHGDQFHVERSFPGPNGRRFAGGPLLDSLLWFTDYHHFAAPVSGTVLEMHEYDGSYNYEFDNFDPENRFGQRPPEGSDRVGWYRSIPKHKRFNWIIDTGSEHLGYVGMSAIGFWGVGSITNLIPHDGYILQKGEPMGHFNYGGSSIVLAFEPGNITDFTHVGGNGETSIRDADHPTVVLLGEQIGKRAP